MAKEMSHIEHLETALQVYANIKGRNWKTILMRDDWPSCQPPGPLIALRNSDCGHDYVRKSKIRPQK